VLRQLASLSVTSLATISRTSARHDTFDELARRVDALKGQTRTRQRTRRG